ADAERRGRRQPDRQRDLGERRDAKPRRARRDGAGPGQEDLHRPPGRPSGGRDDQDHHDAGPDHHPGSQRSAVSREAAGGSQAVAIARGRQGMTVTKGCALLLVVSLAGALANGVGSAEMAGSPTPRLTAISSRLNGKGASLVIEASTTVPYVATRPDPLTVLVDLRKVVADRPGHYFASRA